MNITELIARHKKSIKILKAIQECESQIELEEKNIIMFSKNNLKAAFKNSTENVIRHKNEKQHLEHKYFNFNNL